MVLNWSFIFLFLSLFISKNYWLMCYFFKAFNVINGGSHAGNKLAMQEFMILPTGEFQTLPRNDCDMWTLQ